MTPEITEQDREKARQIVASEFGPPCDPDAAKLVRLRTAIATALAEARDADKSRDDAIKYLESIGAETTEERILLAEFLATQPSVKQVHLATSLVVEQRDRIRADQRQRDAEIVNKMRSALMKIFGYSTGSLSEQYDAMKKIAYAGLPTNDEVTLLADTSTPSSREQIVREIEDRVRAKAVKLGERQGQEFYAVWLDDVLSILKGTRGR